jgi:hypothetical protein
LKNVPISLLLLLFDDDVNDDVLADPLLSCLAVGVTIDSGSVLNIRLLVRSCSDKASSKKADFPAKPSSSIADKRWLLPFG